MHATDVADFPSAGDGSQAPVVLHVRVVTKTGGGPEKTILNSPRFLAKMGYRGICAFMHPPGDSGFEDIRRRGTSAGAEVVSVPDRGAFDWRPLVQLIRICRREQVAIWHGHDYKSNVFGLLARRFHAMRLVTTAHGWVDQTGRMPLYEKIDLATLPFYERIICVSQDLADRCGEHGIAPAKLQVIENAIDLDHDHLPTSRENAKRRLGIPPDRLLIGAVGRLNPEKAFDALIEAAAAIRKEGRDIALVIAGDGPDRERLETLISRQPEPDRFHLLGHCSDVAAFYEALDVFALSSLREGLPNVLLEAMATGVPIVATNVGGIARLVTDGTTGLLVDSGSVPALASGLRRLILDEHLRRRLGSAGRATIEDRYSFQRRMEKIVDVYSSVNVPPARFAEPARHTATSVAG